MKRPQLEEQYRGRLPALQSLRDALETLTRNALVTIPHIDRISFRVKTVDSFLEKVFDRQKSYADPLTEVEDQIGGRILVFFRSDIDVVQEALEKIFNHIESVRKEPEEDSFGYESQHLVMMVPPIPELAGALRAVDIVRGVLLRSGPAAIQRAASPRGVRPGDLRPGSFLAGVRTRESSSQSALSSKRRLSM